MATDLARWRLDSIEGAHRWCYLNEQETEKRPQTKAEKYFLGTLQVGSNRRVDLVPASPNTR